MGLRQSQNLHNIKFIGDISDPLVVLFKFLIRAFSKILKNIKIKLTWYPIEYNHI